MGRNAKPIELHLVNGNKRHLMKAEIEHRKRAEVKFGDSKLVCESTSGGREEVAGDGKALSGLRFCSLR